MFSTLLAALTIEIDTLLVYNSVEVRALHRPVIENEKRRLAMRRTLSILAIALTLLLLTTAAAHARPNEWTTIYYHTVRPGETIYCIARGYGVSPAAIAAHNGILHPYLIRPGQVLAIPDAYAWVGPGPTCSPQYGGPYPCTCSTYHPVVFGDNLYRISLRYGVSMWHIAECNGMYDLHYIRAGDTLCIP
jgi:LysM repeat protein